LRGARPVSARPDLGDLNDPSPQTRADVSIRLGRSKDVRAVKPLVRSLQEDTSAQVREAAARALGLIGSPEALPALQRAAGSDADRDVRKTASFAAEVIRANLRR
jgi:HEAT repeat protein